MYCEDHLVQLWLLGDRALARQIAQRRLAPLAGLTPARRARLLDTLRIWLTTRATAGEMAEQLGVHPQTVRYRIRALERAFGDQLADADTRFATEVALRALHLTDPAPGVTDPAPGVTGPPPHPAGPVPPGHPRRCD